MTKSRLWPRIIVIILIVLVVLVFTAPASLIKDPIENSGSGVQLYGIHGRLVDGQADQVRYRQLTLKDLGWVLHPGGLIQGALDASLRLDDAQARVQTDVKVSDEVNWQISNLDGDVRLNLLERAMPGLALFGINGNLELDQVGMMAQAGQFISATGHASWETASVTVNGVHFDLGTLNARLFTDDGKLGLDFTGDTGVMPTGKLLLGLDGTYQLQFSIKPEQLPDQAAWFAKMGKPQPDGKVGYVMKGHFRK